MMQPRVLTLLLLFQIACAVLYVVNILSTITGFAQFSWMVHELIELGAALGLCVGVGIGAIALRRALRRTSQVEGQLRIASGAFMDVLSERFDAWALTPAERDVALFLIKGLSTSEIATLRNTSDGTVKAQTNAIYRKAQVSGRPQLLSLFIEDLMGDALPGVVQTEAASPRAVAEAR